MYKKSFAVGFVFAMTVLMAVGIVHHGSPWWKRPLRRSRSNGVRARILAMKGLYQRESSGTTRGLS